MRGLRVRLAAPDLRREAVAEGVVIRLQPAKGVTGLHGREPPLQMRPAAVSAHGKSFVVRDRRGHALEEGRKHAVYH